MLATYAACALTLLLPIGGLMGYRKGSSVSLAAGSTSGALMGVSLYFLLKDPSDKVGNGLAAAVSLALTCVMGFRYVKSKSLPPLIIATLNAVCFLFAFAPNLF